MPVYVLSRSGRPLMPTKRNGHVRILLKTGRAKVVRQKPFTIQLLYDGPEITQPLHGGTDPGRTNIGEAVLNEKGGTVYAAHVETRNKEIPKRMEERAAHRRASRNGERKARQRLAKKHGTQTDPVEKPRILPGCKEPIINKGIINSEARFCNRKRPEGWLTPTARQLVQTHLNMVEDICSFLPVTDWTLEINKFAFMRMEDGSVRGVDFQNGRLKGYADAAEYIEALQNGRCAICGALIEHVHHIVPRSGNGSNGPENLVGLCAHCHEKVHTDPAWAAKIAKIGEGKKYGALSVLNQAIPYIYDGLVERFGEDHVHICYGWQTENFRITNRLPKEHATDAACIAALGAELDHVRMHGKPFEIKQYRRHNRARINNQRTRTYKVAYTDAKRKRKWKIVAKNRKKGFNQKDPSLEDYIVALPKDERRKTLSGIYKVRYGKNGKKLPIPENVTMIVEPSKRYYNNMRRMLPGTVFWFEGHRYVMSGQHCGGTYLRAEGEGTRNFLASECRIVKMGGLVYV